MQNEVALREEIARAARGWLGTRFHHQGRRKASAGERGGCDCLGLLVGVAAELGLRVRGRELTRFDERNYGHMPDGERLRRVLDELLHPVLPESADEGDVLLLRFERVPQHLAIVSRLPDGALGMIHALAAARRVVEHRLDAPWRSRIVAAYRLVDGA
jgi:cell wall-associated NlpC family hydrolase